MRNSAIPFWPRWRRRDTLFAVLPVVLVAMLLLLAVAAPPAAAESFCVSRDLLADRLTDNWGELVKAAGISQTGQLIEIWANPETGTWTLTATAPAGLTCVLDAGEAFQLPTTPAGDPA